MTTRLGEIAPKALRARLATEGVVLRIGPAHVRVRADLGDFSEHLRMCYAGVSTYGANDKIVDFEVRLELGISLAPFERRARWLVDGEASMNPLPCGVACPAFEWTLNWAIATRFHRFLMIHAATAERAGSAIVMPGRPGSGKSTLCAALVAARGWRLLSDEFLILDPATGGALPLARPITLKDASIAMLREIAPKAPLGRLFNTARKGDIAYLPAPPTSQARASEPASPKLILFPTHTPVRQGAALADLKPLPKARAFMRVAENSFNYGLRRESGFDDLRRLVAACHCYELRYSDLDTALAAIDAAAAETGIELPARRDLKRVVEHASA